MALIRFSKLICTVMAALFVVGTMAASQAHGVEPGSMAGDDSPCCVEATPKCEATSPEELAGDDCCPSPDEPDDCACGCPCCEKMLSNINLISLAVVSRPIFQDRPQLLASLPDTIPSALVLGVDVQPPIA